MSTLSRDYKQTSYERNCKNSQLENQPYFLSFISSIFAIILLTVEKTTNNNEEKKMN